MLACELFNLHTYMCVHVYACVHVCVQVVECVHTFVHIRVYGGLKSTSGRCLFSITCYLFFILSFFFLRQGLSVNLKVIDLAGVAGQGSTNVSLHAPQDEITPMFSF